MNYLKEMLAQDGKISSKRVAGLLLIVFSIIMIFWLVVREGGTGVVESLVTTALITGTTLLGVSNVTGIWKSRSKTSNDANNNPNK